MSFDVPDRLEGNGGPPDVRVTDLNDEESS
jgi:hypothetical protein